MIHENNGVIHNVEFRGRMLPVTVDSIIVGVGEALRGMLRRALGPEESWVWVDYSPDGKVIVNLADDGECIHTTDQELYRVLLSSGLVTEAALLKTTPKNLLRQRLLERSKS